MIQDNGKDRLDNSYDPNAVPDENSRILYCGNGIFYFGKSEDGSLYLPSLSDYAETAEMTYLFSIGDVSYFFSWEKPLNAEQFCALTLREARSLKAFEQKELFALFTAWHLIDWYNSNVFCGRCSEKTFPDVTERALVCPVCGNKIYPRINPAVIVGVVNGDRLLVTRYRAGYGGSALVAGFTEIGETLEQTVEREVFEETGLKVKNIRYYKSQPWGIAADILAGFWCEVDGDPQIRLDENELKYAAWLNRDEIELQSDNYSLTGEMIRLFKENKA
ncbi:MAG: NAD(+) diphosphatase [Erysipelotrichaceae bacterium]|nr:NAD(+) diphosphatase [Erysipelotrichaceae bacterium]